jgi:predicted metalloprotease with PDZ domain
MKLISFITILLISLSCKTQENVYNYANPLSKEAKNASIQYRVSTPEPHTHYAEVSMTVSNYKKDYIDFKLPTWAPGSYLIREFSRFVEDFKAEYSRTDLKTEQISKNTWRVYTNNQPSVTVKYRVYAYELSVRTSFVDDSHAYLNGTSIFMYVDDLKQKDGKVQFVPYTNFKNIATALPKGSDKWNYTFPNYDILVDCPVEIGNHEEFEFTAAGTLHKVAMYGKGNYDIETLKTDMAKVCEEATNVFGVNPNKEYTFIIHNLTRGSGGLEHLSSTTLEVNRWTYKGAAYKGFLSLVAHEYFHLWNVKRVRPIALGPFDYENENYTHLLWVMEGFTSYYENVILYRAGILTGDELINKMKSKISYVETSPGGKVQSATDASFNAWIKAYRPHENSGNTTVSYYSKGATLALMLEFEIINNTNGKKSLDDVMQLLYNEYFIKKKRGFTDDEFQQAVEKIAGKSLANFFDNNVFKPETVDYATRFNYLGFDFKTITTEGTSPSLGVGLGGNKITSVRTGSAAYLSGLNVNDEIIALNNYHVDGGGIAKLLSQYNIDDEIDVLIARDNLMRTIKVKLVAPTSTSFLISMQEELNDSQKSNLKVWLEK